MMIEYEFIMREWDWTCPDCGTYNSDMVRPSDLRSPKCYACNKIFDPDDFEEKEN